MKKKYAWSANFTFFLLIFFSQNFIMIKVLMLNFFNHAVTRSNLLISPIVEAVCYLTHFDSCPNECDVGLHKFLFCSFIMLSMLAKVSKSPETTVSQHLSNFLNSNIVIFCRSWGSNLEMKLALYLKGAFNLIVLGMMDFLTSESLPRVS